MRTQSTSAVGTWLLALTLPFFSSCGHESHTHAGGHSHAAPRGGVMLELGAHQGYLEFLLDPASGNLSLWALDAHAENPVRLAEPAILLDLQSVTVAGAKRDLAESLSLAPVASALTGETAGNTSEFGGQHAALVGASAFAARVRAVQHRGTDYRDLPLDYQHPAGPQ